jgi:hypothetical protein
MAAFKAFAEQFLMAYKIAEVAKFTLSESTDTITLIQFKEKLELGLTTRRYPHRVKCSGSELVVYSGMPLENGTRNYLESLGSHAKVKIP